MQSDVSSVRIWGMGNKNKLLFIGIISGEVFLTLNPTYPLPLM